MPTSGPSPELARYSGGWWARLDAPKDGWICARRPAARMTGKDTLLLKLSEVAEELQMSMPYVKRLVASGALVSVKQGRSRRVRRSDLEAYVEALEPDVAC